MRILCKDGERERERRGVDVVRLGTIKMVFSVHDIVCVASCLCLEKKETCVVLLSGSSSYHYIIIHHYYQRGILGPQTACIGVSHSVHCIIYNE